MLRGEPGDVVEDRGAAGLDAAVIAVDRLRRLVGHGIGLVEQQADVREERLLVALDGQHVVAAARQDRFCRGFLTVHRVGGDVVRGRGDPAPRGMQPSSIKSARSSGKAVISFDLPSTLRCPSASRVSQAKALIRCSGPWPFRRSKERRMVLPSTATTPSIRSANAAT